MAAQDFYDAAAPPDLSPDAMGVPPVPVPQIPAVTPPQLGLSPDAQKKRQLLSLIALGLSAGMGGPRGTGLAQGISQAFGQQDLEKRQQDQLALQQYEQDQANQVRLQVAYEAAQQRHELERQRRGQQLTSTLTNLKTDLLKAKTKEQADSLLTMYGNALSGSGFRGYDANNLSKRGYRWVEPSVEQRASSYLDDLLKDPINANVLQTLQADPVQAKRPVIQFDANGDKVPEAYTLTDFLTLAGRAYFQDPDTHQIILAPKDVTPKMSTPFEASYATGLEKFKADNHRDPTPPEKQQIVKDAVEASKQPADQAMAALSREMAQARIDNLRGEGAKAQEGLEQKYRDSLQRIQNSRSGGLGVEDQKVNQAVHLLALLDQQKDKNGNYQIPKVLQTELALGLARLVSPSGQVGVQLEQEINQKTAKGDFANLLTYLTGRPVSPKTQDIFKLYHDSIERQGAVAEENRNRYLDAARASAPTDLNVERKASVERGLGLLTSVKRRDEQKAGVAAPSNTPAAQSPAIGEIRLINGRKGRWDGRGWEAVP